MGKQYKHFKIFYQDENGITKVSVRFSGEDIWLTQKQIAEVYDTTRPNVTMHIKNITQEGELDDVSVCKNFLLTASSEPPAAMNVSSVTPLAVNHGDTRSALYGCSFGVQ